MISQVDEPFERRTIVVVSADLGGTMQKGFLVLYGKSSIRR